MTASQRGGGSKGSLPPPPPPPPRAPPTLVSPPPGLLTSSLSRHVRRWLQYTKLSSFSWAALQARLRLPLAKPFPAQKRPNRPVPSHLQQIVDEELQRLLELKAVRRIDTCPRLCSPIGIVPKKGGKWRVILDLRFLNAHLHRPPSFKMEDISTLAKIALPNDFAVKIDLKDGFFHCGVHPEDQLLLGFEWKQQYYVYQCLPFGLSWSPIMFCKTLRPVIEAARRAGIRIVCYMDDILVLGRSENECAEARNRVLALLHNLGWHVNEKKCSLQPAQTIEFLGFLVDFRGSPTVNATAAKMRALKHDLRRLLSTASHGPVPVRRLAQIAGTCCSLTRAVLPGKFMLRNVYRDIQTATSWGGNVTLSDPARRDVTWWLEMMHRWNGTALLTPVADSQLDTDASPFGWGARLSLPGAVHLASGLFEKETARRHINFKEMSAVLLALRSFAPLIHRRTLLLRCDSAVTVAVINRWCSRSPALNGLTRELFHLTKQLQVHLLAVHIPGVSNTIPDQLSRCPDPWDWRLRRNIFRCINNRFGPFSVDRFASQSSALLPRYNSRFHDPQAEAVDAFSVNWANELNFLHPPAGLIPRVLQKLRHDRAEAVLVAPLWTSAVWFPSLLSMLVDEPVPLLQSDFEAGQSGRVEPWRNKRWLYAAFRLSGQKT